MYQDSGKKIVILYILKILRDHTDANHTMTQQQIADKLLSEYGIEVNRATIKRNLSDLMEAGYEIYAKQEVTRTHLNKKPAKWKKIPSIKICITSMISRNQNCIC